MKAYFDISWGQIENTEFALFKSVIWKKNILEEWINTSEDNFYMAM